MGFSSGFKGLKLINFPTTIQITELEKPNLRETDGRAVFSVPHYNVSVPLFQTETVFSQFQ